MSRFIKNSLRVVTKRQNGTILGRASIGYLNGARVGKDSVATVIFDPERAHIVKKMFEDYSTSLYSLSEIADIVNKAGFKALKTNKPTKKQRLFIRLYNYKRGI